MRRLLLLAAVLAAGVSVSAMAQDGEQKAVAGIDPAKDVRGRLDVRRVALGRVSGGKLRAEITLAKAWGPADLRAASGPSGSLCVRLFVKRDPASEPPDHLVCATPAKDGDELVGRVLRDRANGLPRAVDSAIVSRPSQRTVYLRFAQSAIGKPVGVRFSAESVDRGTGCPKPVGCRDLAPDAPRQMYLALRAATR
jgi:hypothetical protein